MKRIAPTNPIPADIDSARDYATTTAVRSKRLGRQLADELAKRGFRQGRILDAGCGPGDFTIELAKKFFDSEITGLDLSEPMLEIARDSAAREDNIESIRFMKGDVQNMPFEDNSFEAVVSLNTLHIVGNPVMMLNEIERVLVPGGALWIADRKRSRLLALMPTLKSAYTADEVKALLYASELRPSNLYVSLLWYVIMIA